MMKHIFILGVVVAFFCSCGDKGKSDKKETASSTKKDTVVAPAPVPLDTADWVEKDLNPVNSQFHLSMMVPKNAKIDTVLGGDVVIHVNSFYEIRVDLTRATNTNDKIYYDAFGDTMDNRAHNFIMLHQDPNGYVYSLIPKSQSGKLTPEREAHFGLYVQKGKEVYRIRNRRGIFDETAGAAYTDEIALKVYDIIRNSGKPKAKPVAKPTAKGHSKGKKTK